jgi:probable rRNA maturation factor
LFTNFEIMPSKSKVYFFFDNVSITLNRRTELKGAIERIFKLEKKDLVLLNYIFCSDKTLLNINRQYLKHDYYTDIITFDLSGNDNRIKGESYISIDRVKDNALKYGQTIGAELHRAIFHGALHLCGYNDKHKEDIKKIREKEQYYLGRYLR